MPREQRVNKPSGTPETSTVPKTTAERRGIRQERIPQGIVYMLTATILFAGSSALSKWLLVTSPGVDTFQTGSLFALGNAILFGTVTVGVRGMTATESTETLTMYQNLSLSNDFRPMRPVSRKLTYP